MSKKVLSVLLVAAGLLGLAAAGAVAQGTITVALPEPLGIGSDMLNGFYYPIDFNSDGLTDFTFGASPGSVSLRTERANRVVIRLSPPPNIGGPVARLEEGFLVGSSLDPTCAWLSSDPVGGYVSPGEIAFATIAMHLSSGTLSEWPGSPGARGFIGVQLELEDGFHFGYFDVTMAAEAGGVLHGWAYHSVPNAPIFARPVPEPSTWALLVGGGVLMVWFTRKRDERRG
ncbi:MAG TPA: PEP-CTERM sorting domain-containing protein [Verrucomicrobiota bacterium]|jgi:hypothetical protein|nr:PEP-CTERM sorting domain-containing protein [Verrucomicrobiota bacterium]OQB90700.1 MAG: hypothetical protein BWX84_01760 [Verrucomicrobia bacterium ADurb.Bin118]HPY30568.1 PEP-CTERM sorting domain-containing protein [Verrucomicrobiota bacterium]HQB15732.1 PEP-CTERM sorting domain-containing protein [Verrucomicrobiota bacterium]